MLCLTAQLRRTYWCKHSVPPVQWGMLVAAQNTGCSEHRLLRAPAAQSTGCSEHRLLELEVQGLISNNCHFLPIHSLLNIKHVPRFPAEARCSNYRVEENWNELSRPQVFAPTCPVVGKVKVQRFTCTLRPCWFRTSHALHVYTCPGHTSSVVCKHNFENTCHAFLFWAWHTMAMEVETHTETSEDQQYEQNQSGRELLWRMVSLDYTRWWQEAARCCKVSPQLCTYKITTCGVLF